MNKTCSLSIPLFVFKEVNALSSPQKCKIPQNLANIPAASIVIVKSKNKRFICKIFYLNECYDNKSIAYMDDSVEIMKDNAENYEIKHIEELELVDRMEIIKFDEVAVRIFIDSSKLDLNIIKSKNDIVKVTKSILKHFTFITNCSIACDRYGIKRIDVISTSSNKKYGNLHDNGKLEVDEILMETCGMKQNIELGGLNDAKEKLSAIISNRMYGELKLPSQVLIYGPIGSGKTSLVHAMANEFNCNIFEISGDIFKPYPGETCHHLEGIFKRIIKISNLIPSNISIVLIENIELFCPKVDNVIKFSHSSRIAALIYSHLDEISSHTNGNIIVIGTTSKIELVNVALRRFSRMGIEISLDMPDENERYEIMAVLVKRMLMDQIKIQEEDAEKLCRYVAANTSGFVGADLEILCQHVLRQLDTGNLDAEYLFDCAMHKVNPSVMRDNLGTITRSTMTLKDIGGMESVKKSLMTCILGPLRHPEKFSRFGLNSPSGILLYGPTGCAKTTIVKCLAGETKMTLISVSSAEIYSPYVGEAEKFIVRLFNQARLSAPAILFFDEIDTIVGSRSKSNGTSSDAHMRILSTLLTEIDGFGGDNSGSRVNKHKPILIIGATNRPECIDDALMRPGRFDKLIHIPAPDYDYRLQILEFLLKQMPIDGQVDIEDIAKRTKFFSGADLVSLCNETAMCAATRDLNCDAIRHDDFENVLTFLRPSLSNETIAFYEKFEQSHTDRWK